MLAPHALALALLTLPAPQATEHLPAVRALPEAEPTVLVIARPEASDLFVPTRMSIRADDLLARNPGLTRATRKEEIPYDARLAIAIGWNTFRQSNLPLAQSLRELSPPALPQSLPLALSALAALLLFHRHRVHDLGRVRSSSRASHTWPVSNQNPH